MSHRESFMSVSPHKCSINVCAWVRVCRSPSSITQYSNRQQQLWVLAKQKQESKLKTFIYTHTHTHTYTHTRRVHLLLPRSPFTPNKESVSTLCVCVCVCVVVWHQHVCSFQSSSSQSRWFCDDASQYSSSQQVGNTRICRLPPCSGAVGASQW